MKFYVLPFMVGVIGLGTMTFSYGQEGNDGQHISLKVEEAAQATAPQKYSRQCRDKDQKVIKGEEKFGKARKKLEREAKRLDKAVQKNYLAHEIYRKG